MRWLVCYCMDGTDGLDETLVVLGWDGGTNVSRISNGSTTIGY